MVRWLAAAIAVGVVTCSAVLAGQSAPKAPPNNPFYIAPPSERVEIDGSKNPESIPEWYIWETFFRVLHTAGTVPSALNLTTDEERLLQMHLERYSKNH